METSHTADEPVDRRASNAVTALAGLAVAIVTIVFVFEADGSPRTGTHCSRSCTWVLPSSGSEAG